MMRAMARLTCLVLALCFAEATAHAQTVYPDELPEDADAGPNERERLAEAARPARPIAQDYSDPELPVYFRIMFGLGGAFNASLDEALATHGFARSPILFDLSTSIAGRVLSWLWLGGRVGAHGRGWARRDGLPAATATGYDLLGIIHLRAQLGRVFELGGMVGGGLGVGVLVINDVPTVGAFPRAIVGAELGLRLTTGMRLLLHGELSYFPIFDLDRYGSDLEFSGGAVSLVLEVRL
jgi:hypothetical protein